ncbi:hypothetical protein [uncultured Tessaracoccus sp.]|uniref:LppU/SCO3897 family protein n=1 Tax=uncultured Tessaracoccus sp. TaxID=905023 RepID=UPI0026388FD5|nr:hypothetical protein [uncultured Tessaracoccus sp.]
MSTPQGPSHGPQQFPGQQPQHPDQAGQPGQPFGQPGQDDQQFAGQHPGQPMGAPGRPKRSAFQNFKLILSVIIVIVIIGVTGWNWYSGQQRDQALTVGQCVYITGERDQAEVEAADCDADGSKQVVLRVIEKHDGAATCDDDMIEYSETSRRRRTGTERTDKTVCLAEVLSEGKFYKADESLVSGLREVKSAEEATFKVSKVHESADGSCADKEIVASYAKWPRTYCLAKP